MGPIKNIKTPKILDFEYKIYQAKAGNCHSLFLTCRIIN